MIQLSLMQKKKVTEKEWSVNTHTFDNAQASEENTAVEEQKRRHTQLRKQVEHKNANGDRKGKTKQTSGTNDEFWSRTATKVW